MMCSKLLKPGAQHGWFERVIDRGFDRLRRAYQRRLHSTLNFRALTALILLGVLVLTGVMYASTPRELAPEEDQGILLALVKTPQIGNLDYIEKSTDRLYKEVASVPEVAHLFVINGFPSVRSGFAGILLQPWDERTRSQKTVLGELGPKFQAVPTAQVQAFSPPALPGSTGGPPMQFVIRTTGDYHDARGRGAEAATRSGQERPVPVHRRRSQIRHAAICVEDRRQQGQSHRRQYAGCRRRAVNHARRQLCQSVQPLWPLISGDPAGAARVPAAIRNG